MWDGSDEIEGGGAGDKGMQIARRGTRRVAFY